MVVQKVVRLNVKGKGRVREVREEDRKQKVRVCVMSEEKECGYGEVMC